MHQAEQDQVLTIIRNIEEQKAYIPYLSDLERHSVFWPIFSGLTAAQKEHIQEIIRLYIIEKIEGMTKTKWGQLFKRFFESQPDLFWQFRMLNENPDIHAAEFQITGKKVEQEMFRLEWILTEKMVGQEKWLDKVVGSFYNIVYLFFPKMGMVE